MNAPRAVAVALVVLLAGCSGILGGGGGTQTPTDGGTANQTVNPSAAPSPTASPTPASPTQSGTTAAPTATPLPDSFETVTAENESLGISVALTGEPSAVRSWRTNDVTGAPFTRGAVLDCARASPFVAVGTNGTVADATVTMDYDSSMLPENASESELAVFAFNRTVQFYLEMETTVHADNDTAVASSVDPERNTFSRETDNGTRTVRPTVDGTTLDNAFVVFHEPTFWEGYETGEIPSHCPAADS